MYQVEVAFSPLNFEQMFAGGVGWSWGIGCRVSLV